MMKADTVRVGDELQLKRTPVNLDPTKEYRQIGLRSFGKGVIHYSPVPTDKLSKLRYFTFPQAALLLSNIKAWEGAISTSTEAEEGFIASNRFLSYIPKQSDRVDVGYLRYYFLSAQGLPLINSCSPGMADRNRTLGIKAFENLRIPLPDITTQRRIARRLDYLNSARDRCAAHLRQADNSIHALHDALCRTSGEVERVGELVQMKRSPIDINPDGEYQQIGVYSFGKGLIYRNPQPASTLSKIRYFQLPPKALVLSNIQAWEKAIAVSREDDTHRIASNRFLTYLPKDPGRVDVNFLRYYFLSAQGHPLILKASPGTMARNRTLGIKAFENLRIPLPDITTQRQIASRLDRAYEALRRMQQRGKEFDALYHSALNQAFAPVK
ncbi:type I restriction enzyme, S subunit [Streptomyces sp. 2231.1]|uniref:restriction endonuclease subunit S n=1 Tax=Streptomyces sp. 2231.1 TaxID=1855347 RepID=UPI00089AB915|nr:restriction endonuclease subunit S [Streptomyces sp. 2231.1]SED75770.1 type I restriction enzyme, S subunit [Streptomyces sp. 2231.1]